MVTTHAPSPSSCLLCRPAVVAGAQPKTVESEFPSWQSEEPGNAESMDEN